jgi:hypothetical protein
VFVFSADLRMPCRAQTTTKVGFQMMLWTCPTSPEREHVHSMDFSKVVAKIYEHLEQNDIEKAVMDCLRLARGTKDYLNTALFLHEFYPNKDEFMRVFCNEVSGPKEDMQKLYQISQNRFLEVHGLDFPLSSDEPDRTVLMISVGDLDAELDQLERSIADMIVPPGIDPFDAAAFTDKFTRAKAMLRLRIKAVQTIKSRLKARCLNYAGKIERQLDSQQKNQGFLDLVQNEVNNFFKARSDDVYNKLQKAAELAASGDPEDTSLLLTEVRRTLAAAADFFYPPVAGTVTCVDGIERSFGDQKYLNRLQEFLTSRLVSSTSKDLLKAELDHLVTFVRRLNDMASKGVHGSVALAEARQGLVGLYFFLFNVSQHLTQGNDPVA